MLNIRSHITTMSGWKWPMSLLEASERKETLMANKQVINMLASFFRAASYSAIRLFLSSVTREVLLFTKISLFLMQG